MKKINTIIMAPLVVASIVFVSGCSEEKEQIQPVVDQSKVNFVVDTPESNKAEIDLLNEKISNMLTSHKSHRDEVNNRLTVLEKQISNVIDKVDSNTSLFDDLQKQVEGIATKVEDYFKPKKIAEKKVYKAKRKVSIAVKPKYKVIGIDQWGAYKYVQLIDTHGQLRLLRTNESVDEWQVNFISEKKVVLVNAKGITLILHPQV